ncbi:MAG: ATP-binding protein [Campylobacterota bacterium]|nr:ATP-binding protein [Campylobacterota bacterium]
MKIKIPFYRKIFFKAMIGLSFLLALGFFGTYYIAQKYVHSVIYEDLKKEFDVAQNITENFITFIGQTSQVWASRIIYNQDLREGIKQKDSNKLDLFLKKNKKEISSDAIILLDAKGQLLSQIGSSHEKNSYLSYLDIVSQTLKTKSSVTKIARERESFIIYSSSLIYEDDVLLGIMMIGYFINDIFLENIKNNTQLEIALIGNSAVMSSTKWGEQNNLDTLVVNYITYQRLLKKDEIKNIIYKNRSYVIAAKPLKDLESLTEGSILLGLSNDAFLMQQEKVFNQTFIWFLSIFVFSIALMLFFISRYTNILEKLNQSAQKMSTQEVPEPLLLSTNDELESLANSFNHMVNAIDGKNEELRAINNDLEVKIKDAVQEIRDKDTLLQEQSKMAALGELLANIAHQWRQPLSAITTNVTGLQIQKEYGVEVKDDELIEKLKNINTTAQHMSETIESFRDFYKSDKEMKKVNIKHLIEKTIKLLQSKFDHKDIQIITDLEDIEVEILEGELIQVFMNLLSNAYDVLEDKKQEEKVVMVDMHAHDQYLICEVKDNGGGVQKDIINKVFDPYFTTKHQSRGTGIGLYMSAQMIKNHLHGDIGVYNETFEYKNINYTGANFKITLHKGAS